LTWHEDKKRIVIMDFNCQDNQKIVIESNFSFSKEAVPGGTLLGRAAELSGLSKWDFIEYLNE